MTTPITKKSMKEKATEALLNYTGTTTPLKALMYFNRVMYSSDHLITMITNAMNSAYDAGYRAGKAASKRENAKEEVKEEKEDD